MENQQTGKKKDKLQETLVLSYKRAQVIGQYILKQYWQINANTDALILIKITLYLLIYFVGPGFTILGNHKLQLPSTFSQRV